MTARYAARRRNNAIAMALSLSATAFGLGWLVLILFSLLWHGLSGLSLSVFTQMTPPPGASGGLLNPIVGSLIITIFAVAFGTPVGILAGIIYWKNRNQFMVLSPNGPETLPCPVWDDVFPNQDLANLANVVCETNTFFGEIAWSVPQKDGGFVQARLKIGINEPPQWTAGPYHHHTAWIDQNVFGAPLGGHEDGLIDQHDVGTDAFGAALPTSLTTGRIKIAEGDTVTQIRGVFPDIKWISPGTLTMTGYFYDSPDSPARATNPYTITPSTRFIGLRGRGRDVAFQITGNDIGSMWRLGLFRYYGQPDGKR